MLTKVIINDIVSLFLSLCDIFNFILILGKKLIILFH